MGLILIDTGNFDPKLNKARPGDQRCYQWLLATGSPA